ncbi:MAG: helix-turn-helix domain-containing protein, partial [Verrucomicrobiales bacterium]|nr:helix-turn-helix domain-containing protein [Verrucomicrobiales bacterium]
MQRKYIVRLTEAERATCQEVIKKLKGTIEKVRRAQILLKADADGPAWTDAEIAEAFSCRTKTVENIRQRFVELGFEQTLERKKPQTPPANKLLDGRQEAQIIATRLGPRACNHFCVRLAEVQLLMGLGMRSSNRMAKWLRA